MKINKIKESFLKKTEAIKETLKNIAKPILNIKKETACKIAMTLSLMGGANVSANDIPNNNKQNIAQTSKAIKLNGNGNKILFQEIKDTGHFILKKSLRDDINTESFHKIFSKLAKSKGGAEEVIKIIESYRKSNKKEENNTFTNEIYESDFYREVRNLFIENGYTPKNEWLYAEEGRAIYEKMIIFNKNKTNRDNLKKDDSEYFSNTTSKIKEEIKESKKDGNITMSRENFVKNYKWDSFENYLLDFNYDGDIKSEKIVGASETQMKYLINEENFPTLIENLNLLKKGENINEYKEKIFTDPEYKINFHKQLKIFLGTTKNLDILFVKDGVQNFIPKYIENEKKLKKSIEDFFKTKDIKKIIKDKLEKKFPDTHHGIIEKLSDEDWNKLSDKIKLEGIAVSMGAVKGLGFSYNIEKLTNSWVDSLQIGIIKLPDGTIVPGIGVSKKLFEKNLSENLSVSSIAGINTAGFFINLGAKYVQTEELQTLFQETKDGDLNNFSLSGNINYMNMWGGLDTTIVSAGVSEIDEESSTGVEKMLKQTSESIDSIIEEIENNTLAKNLDIEKILKGHNTSETSKKDNEKIKKNKDEIRAKYGEIKKNYDFLTKNLKDDQKLEFAKKYKSALLKEYSNKLNKNIEGLNFTGVEGGIIFLKDFMPIPFVMLNGEYNSNYLSEVKDVIANKTSVEIQDNSSEKNEIKNSTKTDSKDNLEKIKKPTLLVDQIGMKKTIYKGNNVIVINNIKGVEISSDEKSQIEVAEEDGKIYISSPVKKLETNIIKKTDNKGLKFIVKFGEGKINKDTGRLENGGFTNEIKNSLNIGEKTEQIQKAETVKMSNVKNVFKKNLKLLEKLAKIASYIDKKHEVKILELTQKFRETQQPSYGIIIKTYREIIKQLKIGSINNSQKLIKIIQDLPKNPDIKTKRVIINSLIDNVRGDQRLQDKSMTTKDEIKNFKEQINNNKFTDYKKYKYNKSDKYFERNNKKYLEKWAKKLRKNPEEIFQKIPIKFYDQINYDHKKESRSTVFKKRLHDSLKISKKKLEKINQEYYKLDGNELPKYSQGYYTNGDMIAFVAGKNVDTRTDKIDFIDLDQDGFFTEGKDYKKFEDQNITNEIFDRIPKSIIKGFSERINKHKFFPKDIENDNQKNEYIKNILTGKIINENITFNYELIFFKWGDCYNSTVAIKGLTMNLKGEYNKIIGKMQVGGHLESEIQQQVDQTVSLTGMITPEAEKEKEKREVKKEKPAEEEPVTEDPVTEEPIVETDPTGDNIEKNESGDFSDKNTIIETNDIAVESAEIGADGSKAEGVGIQNNFDEQKVVISDKGNTVSNNSGDTLSTNVNVKNETFQEGNINIDNLKVEPITNIAKEPIYISDEIFNNGQEKVILQEQKINTPSKLNTNPFG